MRHHEAFFVRHPTYLCLVAVAHRIFHVRYASRRMWTKQLGKTHPSIHAITQTIIIHLCIHLCIQQQQQQLQRTESDRHTAQSFLLYYNSHSYVRTYVRILCAYTICECGRRVGCAVCAATAPMHIQTRGRY